MNEYKWSAYNDLAWIEPIVTPPNSYADEIRSYVKIITDNSQIKPETLLHLGCGAGGHDYTFKKYFKVTGVDISEGMLNVAKKCNPDVPYIRDDMRSVKLKKQYDAVVIPDSIAYMETEIDLRKTITTAYRHLKPGGVLLIVAHLREEFRENNFVYTAVKDDINITIFENNYVLNSVRSLYEAVVLYLIRRKGKLKIYSDRHKLGLFPLKTWLSLFEDMGFTVKQEKMDHLYDSYILGEGEYPLRIFIAGKPL